MLYEECWGFLLSTSFKSYGVTSNTYLILQRRRLISSYKALHIHRICFSSTCTLLTHAHVCTEGLALLFFSAIFLFYIELESTPVHKHVRQPTGRGGSANTRDIPCVLHLSGETNSHSTLLDVLSLHHIRMCTCLNRFKGYQNPVQCLYTWRKREREVFHSHKHTTSQDEHTFEDNVSGYFLHMVHYICFEVKSIICLCISEFHMPGDTCEVSKVG